MKMIKPLLLVAFTLTASSGFASDGASSPAVCSDPSCLVLPPAGDVQNFFFAIGPAVGLALGVGMGAIASAKGRAIAAAATTTTTD